MKTFFNYLKERKFYIATLRCAIKNYWAILLSILFHLTLLLLAFLVPDKDEKTHLAQNEKKTIKVSLKKINKKHKEKVVKQETKKEKSLKRPRQVVNNENIGKNLRPEESRFLGEKDQTYEKQSVSKRVDIFNKGGLGKESGTFTKKRKKVAQQKAIEKKETLIEKPKKAKIKIKKKWGNLRITDLQVPSNNKVIKKITKERNEKFNTMDLNVVALGHDKGSKDSSGLSQNNDYIDDVPLDDLTKLNTIEFKYFGFYSRVRKKLEQYWMNYIRSKTEKMWKSGKKFGNGENYVTSLKIILDQKGNILNIVIVNTSGLKDLDDAAIESFNKAAPFPNPPKGMLEEGQAVLNWGFVVRS